MKKWLKGLIAVIVVIVFILVVFGIGYYYKISHCFIGQTPNYDSYGEFVGCKFLPLDYGRACENSDECKYNCLTTKEEIEARGCRVQEFGEAQPTVCGGISGRCGQYGRDSPEVLEDDTIVMHWKF
jgi:hypothetical protein